MSISIATAVADLAYESGLTAEPRPNDVRAFIEGGLYDPTYERYA